MRNGTPLPDPQRVSEQILKKAQISQPPIILEEVLGVCTDLTVVQEDLDGSGYLLPLGKLGGEIIVNRKDPVERRRFTIAHELGHWALGRMWRKKHGEFKQPVGVPYATIEKWCDVFATNLLMPRFLVESWLTKPGEPLFIDAILRASDVFKVSDEAFFMRVWELLNIQVVILTIAGFAQGLSKINIERNYGDRNREDLLTKFLSCPDFAAQLQIQLPIIFFSGTFEGRRVECSGRRISRERLTVAIEWHDRNSQTPRSST